MTHNIWIYILVSGGVSLLIRILPLTLIRKPITSRFIRSFLYYVPYATLAIMTFPAIVYAADHIYAGISALIIGIVLAWHGQSMFTVSIICCMIVYVMELFL